jgi:hypothetical protein
MEIAATLRMLWRRRLLVGVGVLAAAAVFLALEGGKSPQVSIASTGVVLDTPASQLVHGAPRGAETLAWRAGLLADLMASPPSAARIAREAGVNPRRLVVRDPSLANPSVAASLPRNAAEVAALTPEPYVVALRFDQLVPVVYIEAAAPDRATAVRLAAAATRELEAAAPVADGAKEPPFVVESVGSVEVKEVGGGSKTVVAAALSLVLLLAWCGAMAVASALSAAWRRVIRGELVPG